ncbi:MAG: hypothetical protein ACREBD_14860 [Blastocatellia bacterium]
MTIQIPFDFQVGAKLLPAGKYVIKRDPQTPQLLLIQGAEQNTLVTVHTITLDLSQEPARPGLTFRGYGKQRFLAEVKILGRGVSYALLKSKAERRLARLAEAKAIYTTTNCATTDDATNN